MKVPVGIVGVWIIVELGCMMNAPLVIKYGRVFRDEVSIKPVVPVVSVRNASRNTVDKVRGRGKI
jgi:hypothetical protein